MNALLLIDIQNDFLPGGALAVPNGGDVIPIANKVQPYFDLIVATQDWHPANHASFAANHPGKCPGEVIQLDGLEQVLWPVHCVQDSPGAALAADLNTANIETVIRKGTDPRIDSYSGFFDNARRKATGLEEYLAQRKVQRVYIAGLATDYCVKFTALDAVALGFETYLIEDGCRGVELAPGDIERAMADVKQAGVRMTSLARIIESSESPKKP